MMRKFNVKDQYRSPTNHMYIYRIGSIQVLETKLVAAVGDGFALVRRRRSPNLNSADMASTKPKENQKQSAPAILCWHSLFGRVPCV
jgi:hypothetical protein